MIRVLRWFGWTLLLGATASLVLDAIALFDARQFGFRPMGELWFSLSPSTLNGAQAFVQRYIDPDLWDGIIFSILRLPTVFVLGLPGLLLVLFVKYRRR
jgi:hypothetical protein